MIVYNDEERGITIPNGIGNVEVIKETQDLTGYATEEWVENNFASNSDVDDEIGKLESSLQGEIDKKQPKGNYVAINENTAMVEGNIVATETIVGKLIAAEDGVISSEYLFDLNNRIELKNDKIQLVKETGERTIRNNLATEKWIEDKGYSKVMELSQEEYDAITPEDDVIYVITDAESVDIAQYATQEYVDNKLGDIETILDNIIGL